VEAAAALREAEADAASAAFAAHAQTTPSGALYSLTPATSGASAAEAAGGSTLGVDVTTPTLSLSSSAELPLSIPSLALLAADAYLAEERCWDRLAEAAVDAADAEAAAAAARFADVSAEVRCNRLATVSPVPLL
jgi:hypothetical protein